MESETMTFGEQLAAARWTEGLTKGELAEKLGVVYETIQAWERDATIPSRHNARRLKRELPELGDVPEVVRKVVRHHEAMESTTVYLRPSQVEGLRALSDERLRPVAELIREGIDLLLQGS